MSSHTKHVTGVDAGRVFQALGDATRRAIVEQLSARPVSVSELARPLDISVAAVMQHLEVLEESGLVRTEKIGRTRSCQLEPAGLGCIEQWVYARRKAWEKRFDRLGKLLAEPAKKPKKKG
ncbi:MAG: metalloregulator ArsR/SmtB family transcription factor [Proteobacteria bacterium]|nr:metalloregulator ArsR/SmtB family transcription factor [Pseudomonadota bacterium]